jgi:hypothetical protein
MEMDQPSIPPDGALRKSERLSSISTATSKIAEFYQRHEKYAAISLFALGFLWDSLTLTRVDNPIDNLILLGYLILIAVMIIFTLRRQCGSIPAKWLQKIEPHFPWAMQFCFGGLFSSYVVFYFKSSSFTRTQFFFLILVFLRVANEFLHYRLQNPTLLAILYCFCFFSFLAFFLPVVLAAVNEWIFLLAGLISLIISFFVFFLGFRARPDQGGHRLKSIAAWICPMVLAVYVLYFANLIPPVPLALKAAGIYHKVVKTPEGYSVKYVSPSRLHFWKKWDSLFYLSPGEGVYCYTAIFAPGKVHVPVNHVWSRKTENGWVQTDSIGFEISGGRESGYRGYTVKYGIGPGRWRVAVETKRGQTLGLITFDVVVSQAPHPPLQTRLIP